MLGFHNVCFPENVSWGSSGGPEFKTQVFESFRGYEKRNIDWCQPQMHFNVAYGIKTDVQMLAVLEFFNARQGQAHGFRYKNWGNYRTVNAPIATGDGISTILPMWKFYGFQGSRHYKRLRKIVQGSVTGIGVGAVGSMIEGTDYSIDYDTAEIALNAAPGYGTPIYCSNMEFDEPVRFDIDSIQAVIDEFNSQSLTSLPLIGVKSGFSDSSIFSPNDVAGGSDPYFESVRAILNFDDIANLTTTIDQSPLGNTVTLNGDGVIDTSKFVHGSGSYKTNTTGYVSLAGSDYSLQGVPFTIELFAQRPTGGDAQQTLIGKWDESGATRCWTLRYSLANKQLQFVITDDGLTENVLINYPWTGAQSDVFDYITIDRTPAGWYVLRINGIVQQSGRTSDLVHDAVTPLVVGRLASPAGGQGPFAGAIDSVRVTIGRNRHKDFETIEIPAPYPV